MVQPLIEPDPSPDSLDDARPEIRTDSRASSTTAPPEVSTVAKVDEFERLLALGDALYFEAEENNDIAQRRAMSALGSMAMGFAAFVGGKELASAMNLGVSWYWVGVVFALFFTLLALVYVGRLARVSRRRTIATAQLREVIEVLRETIQAANLTPLQRTELRIRLARFSIAIDRGSTRPIN